MRTREEILADKKRITRELEEYDAAHQGDYINACQKYVGMFIKEYHHYTKMYHGEIPSNHYSIYHIKSITMADSSSFHAMCEVYEFDADNDIVMFKHQKTIENGFWISNVEKLPKVTKETLINLITGMGLNMTERCKTLTKELSAE